ncbi:serine/arginine repetitive matrix protein 2-like [Ostrea edulis]|uniref:serine/arginine repetitive matrix protein 2-like n=1 Tax=Ostrea edulis TaxID=37623 RepID=UPI0024AF65F6|nr:serine/arginine repetitive matrix protein 2-like [Ostrea edulis]
MYGRRSKNTCSKSLKGRFSTRCKAKHSKHITKRHCNGKRFCTLHASNSVFGDPCRGTYKYLAVTYSCRKRIQRVRVHVIKKALRRRRNVIRMKCGRHRIIVVRSAKYVQPSRYTRRRKFHGRRRRYRRRWMSARRGRSSRRRGIHKNVTRKVKSLCNGKRRCTLWSNKPKRGKGYKYIRVKYSCRRIQRVRVHVIKKALRRRRNVIKMKCGRHRVIAVKSAKYVQPSRYTRRRGIRRHRFRVRRRRNRRRWMSARRGRSSRRRGRFSRRRGRFSRRRGRFRRRRGRSSRRRGRFSRRRGRFSRRRGRSSRRRGRSRRIRGIHKNVTRKVKSLCNGKRRCTLWSNKPKRGKGYKYIRVKYSCKNAREGM